jgi:hypothetical protein
MRKLVNVTFEFREEELQVNALAIPPYLDFTLRVHYMPLARVLWL